MSAKFYTLMTDIGAAKLASAAALGIPLKITQMAVGDGGGALPTPDAKQTALVAEKRRAALNMLYIDPQNSSQIIAEQVIPETEGGWWIREVGLFDETGALIAVGNCPESYKPQLVEGSGRTQTVRMVLITSSTDNITLKIDPSVVLATRSYVDNLIETRQPKSDTLTALAELKPAKGKFPYFTAEKAAALADLSDFIRLMLGKTDAAGVLEYLGLQDTVNKATGAMQKASNGSDIADVAVFRKSLQLGTAATRNVGVGSASNLVDMDSIRSLMGGNGYIQIPCMATTGNNLKFYLQWGNASAPINSNNTYSVNIAFPNTILFATGNRWTNGSNASMNVNATGTQGIQIQNWAQSGFAENCAWIAIGY